MIQRLITILTGSNTMTLPSKKRLEKRKYKRINLSTHALIRYGDITFSGEILNISDMGAYLATNAPFSIGDVVELIISFRHGASNLTVTIPSKIARVDGKGIGIISSHMDANMLTRLELVFDVNKNNTKLLIEEFCKAI